MKIYLAGPLGFSEAGRAFHLEMVKLLAREGHDVLDPWAFEPKTIAKVLAMPYGEARRAAWAKLNPRIGLANQKLIDKADVIVAVLDGVDVDSGTASEIGYGFARGKRIIGYRGDFRIAAENEGSVVNLQVEYFIRASGGAIVTAIADLPNALKKVLKPRGLRKL
ncbi:nucleoside 2-deoxyribosyltransferase [Bradyrhizobium sp. SYSU BS000235]|uniref:nucleoside 2-deoxyribosyltransferase n=1 Tax=Bradyrhizobium sp. SYSU BS000235 TaxID=3411332 RepID=UPI003C75C73B